MSDPRAADLTTLMREHAARVRRVLARRGVSAAELPDAEQEVFIVAHRKLAEFEGRSSVATWLLGIASNVASQHRRKARHRRELLGLDAEPACPALDPLARLQAIERVARVRRLLDALSSEQREVIVLHELSELSMHEVARELGVPLKTAFSRLYAGHRALRRALERDAQRCGGVREPRRGGRRLGALAGFVLGLRWLPRAQALQLAAFALVCTAVAAPQSARDPVLSVNEPAAPRERRVRHDTLPVKLALAAPDVHPPRAAQRLTRGARKPAASSTTAPGESARELVVIRLDETGAYARLPYPHPFEDRALTSVDPTRIRPRLLHRDAFCPAHAPCAL